MPFGVDDKLFAGLALSTVATVGSGVQQFVTAQANQKAANAQAKAIEEANAENEVQHKAHLKKLLSSQMAAFAANGLSLEGSPMDFMLETVADYERDASIRSMNAQSGAARSRMQGSIYAQEGAMKLLGSGVKATGGVMLGLAKDQ